MKKSFKDSKTKIMKQIEKIEETVKEIKTMPKSQQPAKPAQPRLSKEHITKGFKILTQNPSGGKPEQQHPVTI